jgi:hypothetical protein
MTITLVYYDKELIIGIKGFKEQGLGHQFKDERERERERETKFVSSC